MANENQTAQDTANVTTLAEIADWMRRCREDLCAHISKYEKWDDGTHTVSLPSQVATLIHVAWELVDYVADTLRLKDGQSEPAESQHQTAQGTATIKPLDAIDAEIWRCWKHLSEYNGRFGDRVDELGETHEWRYLQQAEALMDVAEDRLDLVVWRQSPKEQQAHAQHSHE